MIMITMILNPIDRSKFGFDEFGSPGASAVGWESTIGGSPFLKLALGAAVSGRIIINYYCVRALCVANPFLVVITRVFLFLCGDDGATGLKKPPGHSEVTQTMRAGA